MKLQAPANTGGLTVAGVTYTPDAGGCVDLPPEAVSAATGHGFTPVGDTPAADPDPAEMVNFAKLTKKQLLAFAQENLGVDLDPDATNKDLIAQIEAALDAKADSAE